MSYGEVEGRYRPWRPWHQRTGVRIAAAVIVVGGVIVFVKTRPPSFDPVPPLTIDGAERVDIGPDGAVYVLGDAEPLDRTDPWWVDNPLDPQGWVVARVAPGQPPEVVAGLRMSWKEDRETYEIEEPDTVEDFYIPEVSSAIGPDGEIYLAELESYQLHRIDGNDVDHFDDPKDDASRFPDLAVAEDGTLYAPDGSFVLWAISEDGSWDSVAGKEYRGTFKGDGGPASEAWLRYPHGVAVGPDGSIYVSDSGHHRIRLISPDGIIETVAGGGTSRAPNGPALKMRLSFPTDVDIDSEGNIYFVDNDRTIRRVSTDGELTTIAGGTEAAPREGERATDVAFGFISSIAVAPDGRIYFANEDLFVIDPDGILSDIVELP